MRNQEIKIKKAKASDLIYDDRNMNKGSENGKELINKSFKKFKAGRSILIDKNNRIIGGNKANESFISGGGKNVIIVETTGDDLVAVKRIDIDLDSAEGRELALADNQTSKIDYAPDLDVMEAVAAEYEIDVLEWGVEDTNDTPGNHVHEEESGDVVLKPYYKTHILISFSPDKLLQLEPFLEKIKNTSGVEFEQSSN